MGVDMDESRREFASYLYADGEDKDRTERTRQAEPGDLVAFLQARLIEDEREANAAQERHGNYHLTTWTPTRVLAEIETKRRIIDAAREFLHDSEDGADPMSAITLRLLALLYADHPDYDESWKP